MTLVGVSARAKKSGIKHTLSITPLMVAMLGAGAVQAQQTAQAPAAGVEEIVVTGSRIVRDGYEAPTPVSVIGVEQMQNQATSNLADYVNTLPSLAASATPQSGSATVTSGRAAINALNLRGLGTERTLTLLDGKRVVGGIITGVADVSEFPQQLISRVDVVTGGASSAYGSDAVSGVVNFVLDKQYTGVKGEVSGGITDYGDNANYKVTLTAGTGFANDRGHLLLSGEKAHDDGILVPDREWNRTGTSYLTNPAYTPTSGQPQLIRRSQTGLAVATLGGQIAAGPLKGIAFGPGGTPYNVVFGPLISTPMMQGGSWESATHKHIFGTALIPRQERENVFTYASYDLNDTWKVFGEASWAHMNSESRSTPVFYPGNLTMRADNAFLPSSVAQAAVAAGITNFTFGTMNGDMGAQQPLYDRRILRFMAGIEGSFNAGDTEWAFDAHISSGLNMSTTTSGNTINVPKYMAAIDAIRDPATGAIACRVNADANPANDMPGCVPFNLFGRGVASQAAKNYVRADPDNIIRLKQQVAAFNLSGEPFSTWAGPVAVAFGAEHREESTRQAADPGVFNTSLYFFQVGIPFQGKYTVNEAYLEAAVPLAKDTEWAKSLELNGAVRATDYSTSGFVTTWKVGATYAPINDIRFRGTVSRDIRAPHLADLFQAGTTSPNTIRDPFNNNANTNNRVTTTGNAGLGPEKADTLGFGVVFQPSWLPRFSVSWDYYNIDIKDAIQSLSAQQLIDLCYTGVQDACAKFTRTIDAGSELILFTVSPLNFAKQKASGFDIEASYRQPLNEINDGWAGELTLRGLATHYIKDVLDSGVVGSIPNDQAGQLSSSKPDWRWDVGLSYALDPVIMSFNMRGFTSGVFNTNYIQCTTGCPASTSTRITIDDNRLDGALYFDFSATYKVELGESEADLFMSVRNLTNRDPGIVPSGPGASVFSTNESNSALYDLQGRAYRVGVRFRM
ncbi:MAG: TonB-dependent receptor plug domain-containing protein [Rhodospirillaceae bacterium]